MISCVAPGGRLPSGRGLAAWPLSTSPLMKAFLSSVSGAIAPWMLFTSSGICDKLRVGGHRTYPPIDVGIGHNRKESASGSTRPAHEPLCASSAFGYAEQSVLRLQFG